MPDDQVLVLGAGVAGLAAAAKLVEAGLPVLVVEARERIGGRIRTIRSPDGEPIEAGPEFVHGDSKELQELLEATQSQLHSLPDKHYHFERGEIVPLDFRATWEKILKKLNQYDGPDLSFQSFLEAEFPDLSLENRKLAADYVEGFNAADANSVSVKWLRQTESEEGAGSDEEGIVRLSSGYDKIVDLLESRAKKVQIMLQSRATRLEWREGSVKVWVSDVLDRTTQIPGRAAIVTLPLPILKRSAAQGGIDFVPPLLQKQECLQRLELGAVIKIVLTLHSRLEEERAKGQRGFLHLPGGRLMTWWPLDDSLRFVGWSGGPRALELSHLEEEEILEIAYAELAGATGKEVSQLKEHIKESRVFNWQKDPLAKGAYSFATVGGEFAARQLAEPIAETLFFAGEATDDRFPATVAGAIRSGYRAAKEVLNSRKQSQ